MLKKLLRYDLKFIFRYWWIAALSATVLSVLGGVAFSLLIVEKPPHALISVLLGLTIALAVISLVVFSVLSAIVIYIRFYKNFFTDEGYLTFTLPVKIGHLLGSKLLTALITTVATGLVLFADIYLMCAIGGGVELLEDLHALVEIFFENMPFYAYVYAVQILLLLLLSSVLSFLFLFCCITFGSIITKKAKVPAAIGIYYVANWVFSGFLQIIILFSVPALAEKIFALRESAQGTVIVLVLLAITLTLGVVCLLLYALQYWMLHRKLNLN